MTNATASASTAKTDAQGSAKAGSAKPRKKTAKKVTHGRATLNVTFNNTIITIAGPNGDTLVQSSAGALGFKGARKSTPFAAQMVADNAAKKAQEMYGLRVLDVVNVSGPGAGRDSAIRALRSAGLEVKRLRDTTPIPHNGCRPRKKRRV